MQDSLAGFTQLIYPRNSGRCQGRYWVTFRCPRAACKRRECFEAVYLFYDTRPKEQGRGVADVEVETINDDITTRRFGGKRKPGELSLPSLNPPIDERQMDQYVLESRR